MARMYAAEMPLVTREYAETLAKKFSPLEITTESTMEEIQRNAGQQDVIRYVLRTSGGTSVSGDIEQTQSELVKAPTESRLNRILNFGFFKKLVAILISITLYSY